MSLKEEHKSVKGTFERAGLNKEINLVNPKQKNCHICFKMLILDKYAKHPQLLFDALVYMKLETALETLLSAL